ncbi:putative metalloprotease with PDZ domain [Luteimonas cucumeris]|uniref:Putative metalloprotease with PDZ domain n=1 Tax=Luteimonas cucumeris TaxID=985012 RepID=A0A562KWD3_9GAMM|nr:M61 family metallopeptidase [Luteimonas cucumeris]TWH99739.1 putative metalloprotease with PDZ domain [Luteimonas cucumeris]
MSRSRLRWLPVLLALPLLTPLSSAIAQQYAAPANTPYPGTITLDVDATDLQHRVFRAKQRIPVQPGPMTLLYPQWLPGRHAGYGSVEKFAGLTITGNGQKIEWKRDPLDVYAFNIVVPQGVSEIEIASEFLSPTDRDQGRVVMTPAMLNLQWNNIALYPAGHYADKVTFVPTLKVPAGWQPFTALDVDSRSGDTVRYKPVDFDTLVDSPVYAGKHYKTIDLDPGAKVPVRLNVVADDARHLEAKDDHVAAHRKLVDQAYKLFGSYHYDHYDFLFSLSEQMSGNGLEHHRSSENGVGTDYFTDWDPKKGSTDLLGHEFAHSWNGKFRRPADLTTPSFNVPMQGSLLWVYEGQTQYWGNVLTARAGLRSQETARDALAMVAATYADNRPGLGWRALQDTTNDPIIAQRRPKPYRGWQLSEDYYSGGQMMWLEADARIRSKTGGKKSLDDFARAFYGVDNGSWKAKPYTFDDVVATLNDVVADDWATFLRTRLDGHGSLTGGIEASGWRLVYKDKPNAAAKARGGDRGGADFLYSLGFTVGKDGKFGDVRWDSPAFKAGIGSGMELVAVDDREYSKDLLEDAIKAAKDSKTPIKLTVKDFDRYRTISIDYHEGLRYPHLERIEGKPDYLTKIFAARK